MIPPDDFYPQIEKLCRKHGVLLVMDEVAVGCGRCGSFYASEQWGIRPDIICLAKGFTGGYATMGATLVTEEVFQKTKGIPAYSTFGWIPQDLAAARANIGVIVRERLWENAEKVGATLLEELKPLEDYPRVGDVRGLGMLIGVEIVKDKESKEPDRDMANEIHAECKRNGLLIEVVDHALFLAPPLILTEELGKEGADILREAVRSALVEREAEVASRK